MIQKLRLEKLRYFKFSIFKIVDFFENVYKKRFLKVFLSFLFSMTDNQEEMDGFI